MPLHSENLRRGRVSLVGGVYLVTTVTHARTPLFVDFTLARLTIAALRACDEAGGSRTLAYVLMPDHLHWLFELQAGALPDLVRRFKSTSGAAVNRARGTAGAHVWQAGFHDHALRRDEDLHTTARYIVANPIRAGLVASVRQYPLGDAIWI